MSAIESLRGVALSRASLDDAYAALAAAVPPRRQAVARRLSRPGPRRVGVNSL